MLPNMRTVSDLAIHIEPGRQWSFEDLAPRTIALDGAVRGPALDPPRSCYSFDHHDGCIRLATTATCQQVFDALLLGLDPSGHTVLLNDLDGDSVLAAWLLSRAPALADPDLREPCRALVANVAAVDAHGPAYPAPRPDLFFGYNRHVVERLRASTLAGYPDGALAALLEVFEAIDVWLLAGCPSEDATAPTGPPQTLSLLERQTWVMVVADSGDVRLPLRDMYAQGHHRIVVGVPMSSQTYRYTVAKRSDLVGGFPLPRIFEALNHAEPLAKPPKTRGSRRWGGGSTIGGSPRGGSRLPPERVAEVIDEVLLWVGEEKTATIQQ